MEKRVMYMDECGAMYKVIRSAGDGTFRAMYRLPRYADLSTVWSDWKYVRSLPWRSTRASAQDDLDALAARKGWKSCDD